MVADTLPCPSAADANLAYVRFGADAKVAYAEIGIATGMARCECCLRHPETASMKLLKIQTVEEFSTCLLPTENNRWKNNVFLIVLRRQKSHRT